MNNNSVPLLLAADLKKSYPSGNKTITVLDQTDLQINTREMCAIVGSSGSGKTTLLQILGTLDRPNSGTILFQGKNLLTESDAALAQHRNRNLGFIFQFHHLLPEFSALENVMMPGFVAKEPPAALTKRATALLKQVGLGERLHHRSGELSGGQQQRVALARALVMKPALLLADEPTGNLDAESGKLVFSLLHELCQDYGLAVAMVTHNLELAAAMDRCLTLKSGKLVPASTTVA